MLKIAKLFYFCHLEKLVRPETFGPYYVSCRNLVCKSTVPNVGTKRDLVTRPENIVCAEFVC